MTRRRATSRASSTALAERVPDLGIDVMQVWRNDRFGRGGDHTEFLNAGFPAVRFSVAVENYNWQHQDLRTENGIKYGDTIENMDFPYLATGDEAECRRARLAGQRPAAAGADGRGRGEHGYDGAVGRAVRGAAAISRSLAPNRCQSLAAACACQPHSTWAMSQRVVRLAATGSADGRNAVLKGIRVDDWVFGVSSVSKDGFESPVASAVPGGAFKPYVKPAEPAK